MASAARGAADLAAAGTFFNDYITESEATRKEEASREFNVVLNRYVSKFDPSGDAYRKKVKEFFDEKISLSLGRWEYASSMPTLLGVGLTPLLELAITGVLTFLCLFDKK